MEVFDEIETYGIEVIKYKINRCSLGKIIQKHEGWSLIAEREREGEGGSTIWKTEGSYSRVKGSRFHSRGDYYNSPRVSRLKK